MPALLSSRARGLAVAGALAIALPLVGLTPAAAAVAPSSLFGAAVTTALPSGGQAVAVGDVTGDGRADVVATTDYSGNAATDFHLAVLAGTGSGTLVPPVLYATAATYPNRPQSVAIGDVTGDGRNDVVVGLSGLGFQVFPGTAAGTLGAAAFTPTGDSLAIALGRLDANASLDVAGIGWGTNTVTVFPNDGSGTFGAGTSYPALHGGYDDLRVGDVSGDGRDDLVVMSGQLYADPNVSVLAQLAAGGFAPASTSSVGPSILTHGIGIGDVTGDGRADVVASYGGNRPASNIAVFAQSASGVVAATPTSVASADIPTPVAVADVDLDGRADVITAHTGWNSVGLYLGQADGTLGAEATFSVSFDSSNPRSLAVGDVTGDGWPDIVVADPQAGVEVLPSTGAALVAPGPPTLTSATAGNGSVALVWAAPSTGGTPTSYTAQALPGGATCTSAGLGCTIIGLANGTPYTFTVRAVNGAGISAASNSLTATPRTVPSAPVSLRASVGKAVVLTWSAPASNGGSAVTSYRVYRGTASGGETWLATVAAPALTFSDATAGRKTTYYYRVSAVNAAGEGPGSNEVKLTTK